MPGWVKVAIVVAFLTAVIPTSIRLIVWFRVLLSL